MFGAPTHTPGSSSNNFQFTGQQRDANSGLDYLRARYYDPGTGRFLSQDPIAGFMSAPQTQNRYPYVMNNPANLVDPSGLCGFCDWATSTVTDVAVAVAPYAAQCGVGAAAGAAFGGLGGAAVGCAAGAGSYYLDQNVSGPVGGISQCLIGGAAIIGFGANPSNVNFAAGCLANVAIWVDEHYGANGAVEQCAFAGTAGYVAAHGTLQEQVNVAGAACAVGALSNLFDYLWPNSDSDSQAISNASDASNPFDIRAASKE